MHLSENEGIEGKTFVVTGGLGFVGSSLCLELLRRGAHQVRSLDLRSSSPFSSLLTTQPAFLSIIGITIATLFSLFFFLIFFKIFDLIWFTRLASLIWFHISTDRFSFLEIIYLFFFVSTNEMKFRSFISLLIDVGWMHLLFFSYLILDIACVSNYILLSLLHTYTL